MSQMDEGFVARDAATNAALVTEETVTSTARCLASAFDDDPVLTWFMRNDKHFKAAMIGLMHSNTRRSMGAGGARLSVDGKCASLWFPPDEDNSKMSFWGQIKMIPRLVPLTGVARLGRILRLIEQMEKHHPREQHHYLQVLGVHEDAQGMGLGSSILSAALERNDAEGVPSYLENSKTRNMPFYERHGFKIIGEIKMGDNGPTLWPMWRNVGGA